MQIDTLLASLLDNYVLSHLRDRLAHPEEVIERHCRFLRSFITNTLLYKKSIEFLFSSFGHVNEWVIYL